MRFLKLAGSPLERRPFGKRITTIAAKIMGYKALVSRILGIASKIELVKVVSTEQGRRKFI